MKSLYLSVLLLSSFGVAAQAHADGFVCGTLDREILVKIYNNTDPEVGTRNGHVMVVSDPNRIRGNQTIARFTQVDRNLTNSGALYIGRVDKLIASKAGNPGEYIGGTRLGQLRSIYMNIDFTYAKPVKNGALVQGVMVLEKLNGGNIRKTLSCARYLKKNQ